MLFVASVVTEGCWYSGIVVTQVTLSTEHVIHPISLCISPPVAYNADEGRETFSNTRCLQDAGLPPPRQLHPPLVVVLTSPLSFYTRCIRLYSAMSTLIVFSGLNLLLFQVLSTPPLLVGCDVTSRMRGDEMLPLGDLRGARLQQRVFARWINIQLQDTDKRVCEA